MNTAQNITALQQPVNDNLVAAMKLRAQEIAQGAHTHDTTTVEIRWMITEAVHSGMSVDDLAELCLLPNNPDNESLFERSLEVTRWRLFTDRRQQMKREGTFIFAAA